MTKWHPILYWLFGWIWAYSYAGLNFMPSSYEAYTFMQLETAYECLMRSEAEGFTQENFDTEYWFQKGYIIQFADAMQQNPTPTFSSKANKEMASFWSDMMNFYDVPAVAP